MANQEINYLSYLQSPKWRKKRNAALEKAGHKCQLCNSKRNLHVHHKTYRNIGNERPEDLIVLDARCHMKFHDRLVPQPNVYPGNVKQEVTETGVSYLVLPIGQSLWKVRPAQRCRGKRRNGCRK